MSEAEAFTRFNYYGRVHLRLSDAEFWLLPFGEFLDLWTCHKQWLGLEKPRKIISIDDVIPMNF